MSLRTISMRPRVAGSATVRTLSNTEILSPQALRPPLLLLLLLQLLLPPPPPPPPPLPPPPRLMMPLPWRYN
jgi:hypothetical protein